MRPIAAAAVRAYLADFVAATRYYLDQPRAAREALVKAKQAKLDPELFYAMQDFDRDRDGRINLQNLAKMQDAQIGVGFQEKRIDVSKIVDLGYLPR
jgi:ABC-type nitrate/sulfonate/bicarbonate transport system substrate-binding protein